MGTGSWFTLLGLCRLKSIYSCELRMSAIFYMRRWDTPCQTVVDIEQRTFFPARVPPRKIWLLCVRY